MASLFSVSEPDHEKIERLNDPLHLLDACAVRLNCVRQCYRVSDSADSLFPIIGSVLQQMDARITHRNKTNYTIEAVFSIFLFKDVVTILLEDTSPQSQLHIRSASRLGCYDFGVNKRRVNNFINQLSKEI